MINVGSYLIICSSKALDGETLTVDNTYNLLCCSGDNDGDNKSVVDPKQSGVKPNAIIQTAGTEYELEDIGKGRDNPTFDEDSDSDEEGRGVGVV